MDVPKAAVRVKGDEIFTAPGYSRPMRGLITLFCLFPALAFAQGTKATPPTSFAELYPPLPGVEYYCTDSTGARVDVGGVICVTASCTTWMARCEMNSSGRMAMWRKTQDGCPGAGLMDRLGRLAQTG